ncbi:NAC domain-containing protein 7-like isoform X2 [Macadamia integrifolia]|uniref:NAC domain-containing protein 7-like isoform X2 n=1 Tax=Macadamia integrifolia TaxID=60698 RepID=UPI001C4FCB44|nr:NAC domain-containing protein 7-like isoform X2 [Macadamia integrifolia]
MCSSAPIPPLADIEFHSTDEELVEHLERFIHGAPLPDNVISEVNPYNVLPWNLPENIWYFNSEGPKVTGTGYWKATGEGRRIPKNSTTTGCRTTLEFYIDKAPYGTKTDWMMYEYKIYWNVFSENNEIQDSSSLCRVFLNSIQSPDHKDPHSRASADDAKGDYIHPKSAIRVQAEENCLSAQDDLSRSQVIHGFDENGPTAVSEKNLPDQRLDNPVENLDENYDFSREDYLELLDLVNPESPSSSSENSSCLTMSSDEYFDSSALLRELEGGKGENTQTNQTNSNFSVTTSHGPNQMVFEPTSSGSAVQQQVLNSKMQKHVADQGSSTSSANDVASSSGLPAVSDGKRKAVSRITKLRKKKKENMDRINTQGGIYTLPAWIGISHAKPMAHRRECLMICPRGSHGQVGKCQEGDCV